MKTVYFRLFLLVALTTCASKISAQTYHITAEHENLTDTIKKFGNGDMLSIEYDSVYLLNEIQFKHYRMLMDLQMAVSKDNMDIQKNYHGLVKNTMLTLSKLDSLNKRMKKNADSTSAIGIRLADVTLKNVERADSLMAKANERLDAAQIKLKEADDHLKTAQESIAKEKKLQFWRKVKYAALGLGVGILVTSIFK